MAHAFFFLSISSALCQKYIKIYTGGVSSLAEQIANQLQKKETPKPLFGKKVVSWTKCIHILTNLFFVVFSIFMFCYFFYCSESLILGSKVFKSILLAPDAVGKLDFTL